MSQNTRYYSVIRAQWNHIGFEAVHTMRSRQANENSTLRELEKASLSAETKKSETVMASEEV